MKGSRTALGLVALCLAGAAAGKDLRQELPLPAGGRVSIETYKGSVTVTSWSEPRLEVVARIEPDGDDRHSEEMVAQTEVRVSRHGDEIRIESDYDRAKRRRWGFWGHSASLPFVHYTIRMPGGARLTIDDYKSHLRISGVTHLRLETYKGNVELAGVRSVQLETYKGVVRADFDRLERDSEFSTYKGEIAIALPKGTGFRLDAEVGRRGRLDSDFETTTRAGRRGEEEDAIRGTVHGGGPKLELQTYKGAFRLKEKGSSPKSVKG